MALGAPQLRMVLGQHCSVLAVREERTVPHPGLLPPSPRVPAVSRGGHGSWHRAGGHGLPSNGDARDLQLPSDIPNTSLRADDWSR